MKARKLFATGAALLALGIGAGACTPNHAATRPGTRIEEDDPRWDCRTMGNRVCGPQGDQSVSGCHVDARGYCIEGAL